MLASRDEREPAAFVLPDLGRIPSNIRPRTSWVGGVGPQNVDSRRFRGPPARFPRDLGTPTSLADQTTPAHRGRPATTPRRGPGKRNGSRSPLSLPDRNYLTFVRSHFVAAKGADTAKLDEALEKLRRPMRWLRQIGMSSIAVSAIALLARYM
jgi:hypothetical protein